jgi:hypothetical protein
LLYSRYQLLVLPHLRTILAQQRQVMLNGRRFDRLPRPSHSLVEVARRFHAIALAVTALEARYLPNLDQERVRLKGADYEEWTSYRDNFDPGAISDTLAYPAGQAREDAERLLSLANTIDPFGREWGPLVRRAPPRSWDGLKDNARLAIDLAEAAEILLRFYEDLAALGRAEQLPQLPGQAWHPLHDRLSVRSRTLDEDLSRLGISPHPRVVLAIEGQSEAVHVPKVWSALGFRDGPELMRVLVLGSVDRDLEKVAALAAAPLINRRQHTNTTFDLLKPPTKLVVAVDPEGKYFAPGRVDRTRDQIINEIRTVVEAQGAKVATDDLRELVEIRTWNGPCYELAHFDNNELAHGILKINNTSELTHDQLAASIAETRKRKKDIKEVWSQWPLKVSKVDLAHALWPTLERKIAEAEADENTPVPEIAAVLAEVYLTAQHWKSGSFTLAADTTEDAEQPATPDARALEFGAAEGRPNS